MKTINTKSTLKDLVLENPSLASAMERLGLDYCCGGKILLDEAVAEAGLDLNVVVANFEQISTAKDEPNWTSMNIDQLIDNILSIHHEYLHEELPRLCKLADKVLAAHGQRHSELEAVAKLVYELQEDLIPHMRKEEVMLFPLARQVANAETLPALPFGTFANPVRMMTAEHEITGSLLSEMRDLTSNYETPKDACMSYEALYEGLEKLEADTHLHVHRENNILFPAILEKEQSFNHN